LEQSIDNIRRWLNKNAFFSKDIKEIQYFPNDIIQADGDHLFELLNYVSGTNTWQTCKASKEALNEKGNRVKALEKQYSDVIAQLRQKGALLNTIRPHYLLS